MDAIRKQQDVLMGANRNGDVREVDRKCYDRDVCRLFLSGLCPHELFQLTKMDMGPCPKVHSLQLRKEYEEAKAKGVFNFDRDLEDVIDRLIVECDRKIARALKRLDDEDAKAAIAISVSEVTQTPEVQELSKEIKEKLKEADIYDLEGKTDMKIRALEVVEDLRTKRADKQSMLLLDAFNKDQVSLPQPLTSTRQLAPLPATAPDPRVQEMIHEKLKKAEHVGEQGMVDEAQKLLEEAEALKKLPARQEPAPDSFSKYMAADVCITDEKLHVCDICGAFLSVYDSDRRLADHFGGKLHLGYMQIREKLSELQENANATMEHYSQIESSGSVNSSALPNDKAIFVEGVDVFNRDCVHEMGSEATQFREQMHQFQLPGSSSSTPTNVDQIVEIRVQQRIKEIEDQWRRREERLLRMFRTRDAGLISWMELASEKAGVDLPELPSLFDDDEDNDVPFVSPSNRHPGSSVGFDGPPPPPSIGGVALSPT